MKCLNFCAFIYLCLWTVNGAEMQFKQEMKAMAEQIESLKNMHQSDISRLKKEIEELKQHQTPTDNHEQNEQATLQWAKASMNELRVEMRELGESVNSSALLKHLHVMRNELKQALTEASDLVQLTKTQETRIDKLDSEVGRLKYENQQMRGMIAQLRTQVGKLSKELKAKQLDEMNMDNYNEVLEHEGKRGHKIRHNKMIHTQISRLARSQDQLDAYQQSLQNQLLDVQRRLDRIEEPNWNLITAKIEFFDLETKSLREQLKNVSQKISDFDKVHASLLELREDVESIENKVDKTIPEFRKEISKLDISFAQLHAATSYLRENQENLKQSVKAIAVSVSNVIDRSELERLQMNKLNDSILDLKASAKQHFYRLNDHILKSEVTHVDSNYTEIVSLPELMGEVKELQPVEREYEDLVKQLPKDCSNVTGPPGSYLIHPGNTPVDTWCSNGTTLLQRRYNGTVEFNRKFGEYVQGFGDASSEFWLGLQSMHEITADNCSAMRIDMTDIYGSVWYAQYDHFSVGSADTGYVLEVSGFNGNASDAFEYQNHMEFSAIDRDRDISNTHCAANYEGGWWFSHCQHVNINGKYTLGLTWFDSARNEWIAVATSEMRIFRKPGCV
ncbi:protein scabrous [Zerene cesonia]|uniref:protein scabrous n=1 Tax=Zerene cesonia TaxID=33412 RepID=UPI0018E516C6|nr:protein scabrous [Zerene cesonia]